MSLIEKTFIIIKPDKMGNEQVMTDLVSSIGDNKLTIVRFDLIRLDPECMQHFYPDKVTSRYKDEIYRYMTSGDCGLLQVCGENSVKKMLSIKGKTNCFGLREKYSKDFIHNAFHCPDSQNDCLRELHILDIGGEIISRVQFGCIEKPKD